ncbi:MAG: MBL fold metallo-hydrolase [Deltaproteobacteria bacterium]|nr:MBL fold metallo-hydrolase [Deltaproteobacteria bacterium]
MRFCVLGSGSKGNSTYVESRGVAVLIDAGFSGIEVQRRLASVGLDINAVQALLVTHEHGDHINGVGVLSRKLRIPVFINILTHRASGKTLAKLHETREFETGVSFNFHHLAIHPFTISHDTADPVGFTIADDGLSVGYCTDTGMISRLIRRHLAGCNGLVLESNHDLEMLRNGTYPPDLQQRIRSKNGHLANSDSLEFLADIINPSLRHVVLAHISEANNCRDLVQSQVDTFLASRPAGVIPAITLAYQDRANVVVRL